MSLQSVCSVCNVAISGTRAFHPDGPGPDGNRWVHLACRHKIVQAKAARAERLLECGEEMAAALRDIADATLANLEGSTDEKDALCDRVRAVLRKIEEPRP